MRSKFYITGIIFLVLMVFTTCTKDEALLTPGGESSALKGVKVMVMPSSETDVLLKAEEDWNNINDALLNAGPGETVQLAEGLFYLHKSVVVWDFCGILKGAGKNKTTIQTAPGALFDVSACTPLNWPWATNEGHFVISFPQHSTSGKREITVTDLRIHVTERATEWRAGITPSNPAGNPSNRLQGINVHYENLTANHLTDRIDLDVTYKDISVHGEMDGEGVIIAIGLTAFGASEGKFEAKNVDVKNVFDGINADGFCGEYSVVSIKNCTMENVGGAGSYCFTNSRYNIIGNELTNVEGYGLLLYSNNSLQDASSIAGSAIKDNIIEMSDNFSVVAIWGNSIKNVDVFNNTLSGSCITGIVAYGIDSDKSEYWSITDNDLCGLVVFHFSGMTIGLNNAWNTEVKNNANQIVGGPQAGDPSNYIGENIECDSK